MIRRPVGALVLVLSALAVPIAAARGQAVREGLNAVQVFTAADAAKAAGRIADALTLYDALTHDPDLEVRTEARFRKGMLLASLGRDREAAVTFRALLDEKPDAARVRLELARVLARMGDEAGARRAIRQAQSAGLPPDVALVVDQFATALRSTKRTGGSFELALSPDSNINRATSARTLDTVIAPLTLSDDARQQSGLGVTLSGQGYARIDIADSLTLLPRMSARASLYRAQAFDDISASALVGLEWRSGRDRLTPSVGPTWRWYGGTLYARTATVAADWIHPIGRRAQVTVSGSAAHAAYRLNALQSGGLYDLSVGGEYALTVRSGVGGSIGMTRQSARDPGYATTAGYASAFGWRDIGRTTLFVSASIRHTESDARLFLFPRRRKEWLYQLSLGATLRALTVHGFAPVVRIGLERNASTVGLYDYKRLSADIGITRAF